MQLTPRYGSDPVITLDGSPADILAPAVRQRQRLAATVASFTDEQWAHPSRCEGWSSRDVIVHLDSTNTFWAFAISAGLRGEPTQFLATFDPVASPAQLVEDSTAVSNAEACDRFVASTGALVNLLTSLDADAWPVLAEAPPGHISIAAVTHHALWDSWVHERDILLPLGLDASVEADEVIACLRYVAALGPSFALNRGETKTGALAVSVTEPEEAFFVKIGEHVSVHTGTSTADLTLAGDAVELLEALSVRVPLTQSIPADSAWMMRGLTDIFDARS
jgi:uncharacterized protein (TIGR03083 family)